MTLALYGKSRRRQGGLILAGFVALLLAMIAGVATFSSAFAHHLEGGSKNGTCEDPSWYVNVTTGQWGDYREAVLTITDATTPLGGMRFTPYISNTNGVILQANGTGEVHTAGNVKQYTGSWGDSEEPASDINSSTTQIEKGGNALSTNNWDSDYVPGVVIRWDNELMLIVDVITDAENDAGSGDGYVGSEGVLIVERGFGDSNASSHNDDSGDDITRWIRGGLNGSPNTISWDLDFDPDDCLKVGIDKVVPVNLPPQGPGDEFSYYVAFEVVGTGSPSGPHTITDTIPDEFEVVSATGINGSITCDINGQVVTCTLPQGVGGNTYSAQIVVKVVNDPETCGVVTNTANLSGPNTDPQDNSATADVSVECRVVLDPGVDKVKHADGITPGDKAYWSININNTANTQDKVTVYIEDAGATFVSVANGTCTDDVFDSDGIICEANAGAIMSIKVSKPAPAQACERQDINNTASIWLGTDSNGKSLGTVGGTNDTKYDIGADTSLCGKPGITKTHTGPTTTSNPSDVSWTVQVINPESGTGIARTVRIKDSNVEVLDHPDFDGGANCGDYGDLADFTAALTGAGIECQMPASSAITFKVAPAGDIARTCNDQVFKNTAYLYLGDSTDPIDSAAGPDITLTKDLTSCEVKVTFSKYICQEYSDVPRNEGPGGQNDIGKNDGPAGLDADDLGAKGPADNGAPVTPANDNEGDCELAKNSWTFNIFTNNRVNGSGGTLLQTFAVTGSQQITLNANALAETLKGSGAYVEEVYQAGYGFGAIKCYTDHLNDDNWEWLNFQSGIPTGEVHCIAYNVPATRDLEICKVVVGNGDGIVDGGVFKFNITGVDAIEIVAYEPAGDATNDVNGTEVCKTVKVGTGSVTVTEWTARPPTYGWEGSWNGDDPAYPQNSLTVGKNGTAIVSADFSKVTFYNKTLPRTKEIVIEKRWVVPEGYEVTEADWPTFTLDPEPPGFDFGTDCQPQANFSQDHLYWTCTVPADWTGTVNETPPAGWIDVSDTDLCVDIRDDLYGEQSALIQAVTLAPDFVFCNQPVGTVVVIKYENVFPAGLKNWTIDGDFPSAPFVLQTNGTGQVGGTDSDEETFTNVPVGDYSLDELLGREACTDGSTSSDFETRGLVQVGGSLPSATDVNAAPIIGFESQDFTVQKGVTTYVAFGNVGCGLVLSGQQLEVTKYLDLAGNFSGTTPLAGWTITATGIGGAATGDVLQPEVTNAAGKAFFLGIDDGTYEVCETPQGGYDVIGSKYNGSTQAGACRTVVVLLGETTVVDFYNQPRLNIVATKTIFNNANPAGANGGAGWTFTLNGCGVGPDQKTTDASGTVMWTDLAPAVNCSYTVTETAKAGWVADQISKSTSAQGGTVTLSFVNRQIEGCTNINNCRQIDETPTPTNTPVTPTSTPDTDETPTEEPTEPKPTETAIQGEKTPGPGDQATPIAPDTGAGFGGGTSAGMNVLLIIAGLIAISGGLSFIALGRRKS